MSFVVLKNNLKEALFIVERALGENINLPILKSFYFNIYKDKISISSTSAASRILSFGT